jgi:hypothetical protein
MPAKKNPFTVGEAIDLKGYDFVRRGVVVDNKIAGATLVEFADVEPKRRMLISNDLLRKVVEPIHDADRR